MNFYEENDIAVCRGSAEDTWREVRLFRSGICQYTYASKDKVPTMRCRFLSKSGKPSCGAGLSEVQQETDAQAGNAGNVHRQSQRVAWRQIRLFEDRLSGHAL